MVARNMYRSQINTLSRIVHLVGFICNGVMEIEASHAYVRCGGGERPLITAIYKKSHRIIDYDLLGLWQTAF